jgi:large subunit ribosomal protein L18
MMTKKEQRLRRSRQTRQRIAKQNVARLTVFRSNVHIYASVNNSALPARARMSTPPA